MSEPDPYLLGYRQAEQDRLERQADELAPESDWLFDQIGVVPGGEWSRSAAAHEAAWVFYRSAPVPQAGSSEWNEVPRSRARSPLRGGESLDERRGPRRGRSQLGSSGPNVRP